MWCCAAWAKVSTFVAKMLVVSVLLAMAVSVKAAASFAK